MKAISYLSPEHHEKTEKLFDIEIPIPTLKPKDVLVKIGAISVNPIDTKVRHGHVNADTSGVLGWDAVGEIMALGSHATHFKVGDKVWYAGDLTRAGSNAEFQAVDERIISLAPTSLSSSEAAALPLTGLTAWEMLFDRLAIRPDSTGYLLIIGGAGGVGSIAIQLLKARTKMRVIATASREETQSWVKSMGADFVINHTGDLKEQLEALGIDSIDAIFSTHSTDSYLEQIEKIIMPQGKLGVIDDPKTLDIMPLKAKSISIHWELMFTRSMFETKDIAQQGVILKELARLIDQGVIKTTTDQSLGIINAKNLQTAHDLIGSGSAKGKVVLTGF